MEDNDLAPWAHPKAKKWFATLIERSGFANQIEDTLQLNDDQWELAHGRIILAMLIIMGRPGIWPDDKARVLQRTASKINALSKLAGNSAPANKSSKPLTIEQHQRNSSANAAINDELELLRRRAGMSNRKSPMQQPKTWGRFWD